MPEFAFGESELAEVTGIALKTLARHRVKHLREGTHWAVQERKIAYAREGLVLVLEKVSGQAMKWGQIAGVELSALEAKTRIGGPARTLTGTVTRTFMNPHLIELRLEDGRRVNVRVKSSKNFRRGMEAPATWCEGAKVWELARACPRFMGRW